MLILYILVSFPGVGDRTGQVFRSVFTKDTLGIIQIIFYFFSGFVLNVLANLLRKVMQSGKYINLQK